MTGNGTLPRDPRLHMAGACAGWGAAAIITLTYEPEYLYFLWFWVVVSVCISVLIAASALFPWQHWASWAGALAPAVAVLRSGANVITELLTEGGSEAINSRPTHAMAALLWLWLGFDAWAIWRGQVNEWIGYQRASRVIGDR